MISNVIRRTYDARAPLYNAIVRMLSFGGDSEYRRAAVAALDLKPGDRVLDIGCGTGLNFRDIAKAVGPAGLVVGTDLSHGMLSQVEGRPTLRLVQAAASQEVFKPGSFDAILSTYVISTILDEEILGPLCRGQPGGRLVIATTTCPRAGSSGRASCSAGCSRRAGPISRARRSARCGRTSKTCA